MPTNTTPATTTPMATTTATATPTPTPTASTTATAAVRAAAAIAGTSTAPDTTPGRTGNGAGSGGPAGTRRPPGHPGDGARRRTPARTRPASRRDQRRPALPSPDPRRRVTAPHHWFAEALLAVLSGQRPVHFLLGHTVGPAYEQLIKLTQEGPPRDGLRPVLRHCGLFRPRAGAIEAFARVAVGDRVTAMAFRLERGQDLRWRCAAVEIAPRPY
ncbi:Rv3235 family protein [Streptomyces sp. NPDC048603]|uniref:Rv3235 family protein n=1 Tax=Streptomyces sp. NPDC048603 TaxID=3365577 RepID=UPI00371DBD5F